jgi:hypothetical protein
LALMTDNSMRTWQLFGILIASVNESAFGPKRSRRLIAFVSVIRGTAAATATKSRGRK